MRAAGIDVGSQSHAVAMMQEPDVILVRPQEFGEDQAGYAKLLTILGPPTEDLLVILEATGHYGQNLMAMLWRQGYRVSLVNPIRTRRFAEEDLRRSKNDKIDALGIARFGIQKRPPLRERPDEATVDLREAVRSHDRIVQDLGDRVRQLHRLLDLGFPEFTRFYASLDSKRVTRILRECPTAAAFTDETALARLTRPGTRRDRAPGRGRALDLIAAAKVSVGQYHGPAHCGQVRYLCDDIDILLDRLAALMAEIQAKMTTHELGSLLLTIPGVGVLGVAHVIAAVGDPARFRNSGAFAAYVGAAPGTSWSGLSRPSRAKISPLGNARLRTVLFMTTLGAVQRNPWLRAYHERLRARGKLPKVALVACMRKLLTAMYAVAKHRRPFVIDPATEGRD